MRKEALILLFVLACNVSAAGMKVTFSDIFPQCAADRTGNYNVLRCGAELIVPNMHIGAIWNMFVKCIGAVFKIAVDFVSLILSPFANPGGFAEGFLKGVVALGEGIVKYPLSFDPLNLFGTRGSSESVSTNVFNGILTYVLEYILGILTPILVVFMLLTYELIKTYLVFAIPMCLYKSALDEAGQNTESEGMKILLILLVCASIFFGTIFLLGLDVGIWNIFINWGNQDVPLDNQGTFNPGGGSGGGGGGGGGAG